MAAVRLASARNALTAIVLIVAFSPTAQLGAQDLPASIRTSGQTELLTVHAEGAQVYECGVDKSGGLAWRFREPIATLFQGARTVGRHYAGPRWELVDGGTVQGKVEADAPGVTASDIPWLKLAVIAHQGKGVLDDAATIQRINTRGGVLAGACDAAGMFRAVAYSADYVFLTK